MHQLKATGLPNVRLASGYSIEGTGDDQWIAYQDLDGLYHALACEVACRGSHLSAAEFRFLRKRLGKSQGEVGARLGVTDQAVAKWEKGTTAVPVAAGQMLRIGWLQQNAPQHLARAAEKMWCTREFFNHGYVLAYEAGKWVDVSKEHELIPFQARAAKQTWAVMDNLMHHSSVVAFSASTFSET